MSKISVYMDNVFAALPKTQQALLMKEEITASLEEQYSVALAEGKNENEALGLVIAQFGTVEELREALAEDITGQPDSPSGQTQSFAVEWVQEYTQFKKQFSKKITLGICLCIVGLAAAAMFDSIYILSWLSGPAFFGLAAVGVGFLVYYGMENAKYEKMFKMFGLDSEGNLLPPAQCPSQTQQEAKTRANRISSLIMAFATLLFFVLGFVLNKWAYSWIVFPIGGVLCGVVNQWMGVPEEDD